MRNDEKFNKKYLGGSNFIFDILGKCLLYKFGDWGFL